VRGISTGGTLYEIIPDDEANEYGLMRVIDEEGEDYGYPADRFFPVQIPQAFARRLHAATKSSR
jgi:hypothetical protein